MDHQTIQWQCEHTATHTNNSHNGMHAIKFYLEITQACAKLYVIRCIMINLGGDI